MAAAGARQSQLGIHLVVSYFQCPEPLQQQAACRHTQPATGTCYAWRLLGLPQAVQNLGIGAGDEIVQGRRRGRLDVEQELLHGGSGISAAGEAVLPAPPNALPAVSFCGHFG